MHTVLGIAEQVRFCDAKVNPTYNGRQDDYRNPINCTWGFHRPPKLPEAPMHGQCKSNIDEILEARWKEVARQFSAPSLFGGVMRKRREAWSTNDRPAYLHK